MFLIFPRKCALTCQNLFSRKNKKYFKLSSAENLLSTPSFDGTTGLDMLNEYAYTETNISSFTDFIYQDLNETVVECLRRAFFIDVRCIFV